MCIRDRGALAVGINATPIQMLGQKVLILGFGRIASQLAMYLTAMGCEVTVAARSREKRAKARMSGCHAVGFDALCNTLPEVTLIYNTVPVSYTHLDVYKRQISTLPTIYPQDFRL